jgi:hypothetical protein
MTERTVTFTVTGPGTPQWLQGKATLTWHSLATTIASAQTAYSTPVVPGVGSNKPEIVTYSGGAFRAATGELFHVGGGHNNYAGNEVLKIDLSAASPTWAVVGPTIGGIKQPTGGGLGSGFGKAPLTSADENADYYYDGRPGSRHTYANVVWHEARQKLVLVGALAKVSLSDTQSTATVSGFDPVTGDYESSSTYSAAPVESAPNMSRAVYDSNTGSVWVWSNRLLQMSGTTWTNHGTKSGNISYALGFDPVNNLLLRYDGDNSRWQTMDLNNPSSAATTVTITGVAGGEIRYSISLGGFIHLPTGGTTVSLIRKTGSTWSATPYTISGTPGMPDSGDAWFNKAQWVEAYQTLVVYPTGSSPLYFLRIP